jgi:glycosyltransferase involved in cell wall biosynthesis
MLTVRGHTVYHYGVEGSEVSCSENIECLAAADHEWEICNTNKSAKIFTFRAIAEITKRFDRNDFILCPFGTDQKPIADEFPSAIVVEPGIGYEHTFAQFRVFESYAWMNYQYGLTQSVLSPGFYDAVIPGFLDVQDYPFYDKKEDYFAFIGRPSPMKGLNIASEVCKRIGARLVVAGQGTLPEGIEAEHVGVVSIEERAELVGKAKGLFCPTYYIEPFGTVAIEAMAYGTPVITTDMGAFTETVKHGQTGWRCRTLEQFVWAAKHINEIDPYTCRHHSISNYGLPVAGAKYEEYFGMLQRLYHDPEGWYAANPDREGMQWLM